MTSTALADLWLKEVITLGMLADETRQRTFPDRIVTYCLESAPSEATSLTLRSAIPDFEELEKAASTDAIIPIAAPDLTAVEYLKFVALCRLAAPHAHLQLDPLRSGLKVAQIALRFGADDFGSLPGDANKKPGIALAEEDVRRVIRDAGFVPKRRDPAFQWLSID